MIQFQGFKPESMPKIANSLGYNGDMQGFQQYLDQNKDKQDMMNQYTQKAQQMAAGGMPNKYKGFSNLPEDVRIGAVFGWVYYLWGGSIVTANDEHKWFDTWAWERITQDTLFSCAHCYLTYFSVYLRSKSWSLNMLILCSMPTSP